MQSQTQFIETVPVFINVRDRLSCLMQLLAWLERAGHRNITLIDNASSYPPLVKFLENCRYRSIRLRKNLGHTALWKISELTGVISKQWFVYTDPDVIPAEKCPLNAVAHLHDLLQQFPDYLKAGLGLKIDDIPDHYHLKQSVIDWETVLYGREIAPDAFQADVDTTFALHRPRTPYITGPAMRLRGQYEARHIPWYVNSTQPDNEELYYREHASTSFSNWNTSGEMRLLNSPEPGGIAARMEKDPQSALEELLRSYTGRTMSLIRRSRRLLCMPSKIRTTYNYTNANQDSETVLEILTSGDWKAAWKILEPLRNLRSRYIR